MADITLNSSMRSNLLSLQNVSRLQDIASNRLATGLKVNSAIDNPSSYYTAQSLADRASDLNALLDSMSQGIQALKNASDALAAGTQFLQQAKAVAGQALEKAQPLVAKVNTEAELLAAVNSGKQGLIVVNSNIVMSENSSLVLKDGQSLVGAGYLDKNAAQTSISFNITEENKNAVELGNNSLLSDLTINGKTSATPSNAVINGWGKVNLRLQNINITLDSTARHYEAYQFYSGIRGGEYEVSGYLNIKDVGAAGASGANTAINNAVINAAGKTVINVKTTGDYSPAITYSRINMKETSEINIHARGTQSYGILTSTISIYDNARVDVQNLSSSGTEHSVFNLYSANAVLAIDSLTGETWWTSLDDMRLTITAGAKIITKTGTFTANQNAENLKLLTGDEPPTGYFDVDNTKPANTYTEFQNKFADFDALINATAGRNDLITAEPSNNLYLEILNQYDSLVSDSSYKGINLLKNDSLKINFNEDRSSGINIAGVNASAEFLGLSTLDWKTSADIEQSIGELDNAVNKLRSYASEFGNYYNIVSTREEFTENLINVLTEGADKLTLADMNQESANMLALQTRQQLAVNSLSLANQAAQSILKLF